MGLVLVGKGVRLEVGFGSGELRYLAEGGVQLVEQAGALEGRGHERVIDGFGKLVAALIHLLVELLLLGCGELESGRFGVDQVVPQQQLGRVGPVAGFEHGVDDETAGGGVAADQVALVLGAAPQGEGLRPVEHRVGIAAGGADLGRPFVDARDVELARDAGAYRPFQGLVRIERFLDLAVVARVGEVLDDPVSRPVEIDLVPNITRHLVAGALGLFGVGLLQQPGEFIEMNVLRLGVPGLAVAQRVGLGGGGRVGANHRRAIRGRIGLEPGVDQQHPFGGQLGRRRVVALEHVLPRGQRLGEPVALAFGELAEVGVPGILVLQLVGVGDVELLTEGEVA